MLRMWYSNPAVMNRRSDARYLLLLILCGLGGCGGASPQATPPHHTRSPSTSNSTATPTSLPTPNASLPSNPCELLTPGLAKALYADVMSSGEHNAGSFPECRYSSPNPAPRVDQVTLELGLISTPEVETPRQTAEKGVADSHEDGDAAAHFLSLAGGPGQETMYFYAESQGGGSEQSITWRTNGVQASLTMSSMGESGHTGESRDMLEGIAADINHAITEQHP